MFFHLPLRRFFSVTSLLFFVLPLIPVDGHARPFHIDTEHLSPLNPEEFNLPSTAQEVPAKRTASSVTFEVSPGSYASVSSGEPMFTEDEHGHFVPIEQSGKKEGNEFVFDRLADGVDVRFNLNRPEYTLSQNGHSFRVAFAGRAEGIIENDHTIAYQLADGVILRWSVEGNTVEKMITVTTKNLPDLSFEIIPSTELSLSLVDDIFSMHNKKGELIFSTKEPFLMDKERTRLSEPVYIVQKSDGRYAYDYSAVSLPSPYIIDPTSGPLSGSTFTSAGGGTVAWSNPSNAASQNGSYATAAVTGGNRVSQLLNATGFSFPVASNDTVDGIMAEVYWSDDNGGAWSEHTVTLLKGGTAAGTDKGIGATPTINTYTVHGGAADLWGTTWAGNEVNSSGFGIAVAAEQEFGAPTVRVDHLRLTVYYTLFFDADAPVSGPQAVPFFSWWSLALFAGVGGFILSRFDPEKLF